jgi:hypothetical protein
VAPKKATHKRAQSHVLTIKRDPVKKPIIKSTTSDKPKTVAPQNSTSQVDREKFLHCLKDSMKLFEKIQHNFTQNAIDGSNRENEIKTILKDIKINEYPYISDFEKKLISDQIVESSQQRIKNYENLFSIINTSLKDLKGFFIDYFNKGKTVLNI